MHEGKAVSSPRRQWDTHKAKAVPYQCEQVPADEGRVEGGVADHLLVVEELDPDVAGHLWHKTCFVSTFT